MQLNEQSDIVAQVPLQMQYEQRLNADNANKKVLCIFWGLLFLILTTVLVSSYFTPSAIIIKNNKDQLQNTQNPSCNNPVEFENGVLTCEDFSPSHPQIGLILRHLSTLHQFAQINIIIIPKTTKASTIRVQERINVKLMTLNMKEVVVSDKTLYAFQKGKDVKTLNNFEFDSDEAQLTRVVTGQGKEVEGFEINLGYYRNFESQNALLVVTFLSLNKQVYENYDMEATAILMNPTYTIFILVVRAVLLVATASSLGIYYQRSPKPISLGCTEQRAVMYLGVAIILFNDPYYFINLVWPNFISVVFSTSFVAIFLLILLISWIHILHKINNSARGLPTQMTTCRVAMYGLVGAVYLGVLMGLGIVVGYYTYTETPIIPYHTTFRTLFLITAFVSLAIFGYVMWLYMKISQVWERLVWRDQMYLTFNIFFIVLLMFFSSLGWFSIYDQSSQKFEVFYLSMNIYVLYMQYMYSPPLSLGSSKQVEFEEIHSQVSIQNEPIYMVSSGSVDVDLDIPLERGNLE